VFEREIAHKFVSHQIVNRPTILLGDSSLQVQC